MNFTVNVQGLGPLVDALLALASALRPSDAVLLAGTAPQRIEPADRPDAGAEAPLALMQPAAAPALPAFAVGFVPPVGSGGAVAPVPPPAPSTAVAAASPTAPAVPTAGVPLPPTAASTPALPGVPVAHAPLVPAAPTTPASGAVQLDSRGLPWDHRIHSSPSKSTDPKPVNKDGSWRQKRGTADTYVLEIEAQLRAALAANGAATTLHAPSAPHAPVAPAAPVAPVAPATILFGQLATKLEPFFVSQRLTWDTVNPILAKFGLQQFNQMMHTPALVPLIDAEVSALLGVAPGVAA